MSWDILRSNISPRRSMHVHPSVENTFKGVLPFPPPVSAHRQSQDTYDDSRDARRNEAGARSSCKIGFSSLVYSKGPHSIDRLTGWWFSERIVFPCDVNSYARCNAFLLRTIQSPVMQCACEATPIPYYIILYIAHTMRVNKRPFYCYVYG